jgi:hypothetical protein
LFSFNKTLQALAVPAVQNRKTIENKGLLAAHLLIIKGSLETFGTVAVPHLPTKQKAPSQSAWGAMVKFRFSRTRARRSKGRPLPCGGRGP